MLWIKIEVTDNYIHLILKVKAKMSTLPTSCITEKLERIGTGRLIRDSFTCVALSTFGQCWGSDVQSDLGFDHRARENLTWVELGDWIKNPGKETREGNITNKYSK